MLSKNKFAVVCVIPQTMPVCRRKWEKQAKKMKMWEMVEPSQLLNNKY